MKLFLKRKKSNVDATGEYNCQTKEFILLKGSRVSSTLSNSKKFRGLQSILIARSQNVKDNLTIKNLKFSSSSTAANFVTGTSANGFSVWKNSKGEKLSALIKDK